LAGGSEASAEVMVGGRLVVVLASCGVAGG